MVSRGRTAEFTAYSSNSKRDGEDLCTVSRDENPDVKDQRTIRKETVKNEWRPTL